METLDLFRTFGRNELAARDVDPAVEYLRYMVHRMEMNEAQVLWLCFLYGITYHLPAAYLIWSEFPDLELADPKRLGEFWEAHQSRVPFQVDKMKQRRHLPKTVASYQTMVDGDQVGYFASLLDSDPGTNFTRLWSPSTRIAYFGRFSIWNWAQMLKHVGGLDIDPPHLMLGEPDSVSFTDGLAYAFGYPERVTRDKLPYRWSRAEVLAMELDCAELRDELDIDNFQLETLACAFKKVWRERDSRYIGYYHDRLAEDISKVEATPRWSGVNWSLLWAARDACVPDVYRNDLGVDKSLFTGTVIEKITRGVEA